jgi:formate dehydrogenase subunit gamma
MRSILRRFAAALATWGLLAVPAATLAQAPTPAATAATTAERPEASASGSEAQAQRQRSQPGNNAPVWRDVNSSREHTTTLPRHEGGVLIQREGEGWRQLRNGPVTQLGGWALIVVVIAVAAFHAIRGQMRLHGPKSGRLLERFTVFERTVHWSMAISFVLLALTGLALLFGRHVVIPLLGHVGFSWVATAAKLVHNYLGPLFSVCVVFGFLTFLRDNIPHRSDLIWVKAAGGLFNGKHVPSHRFNAGEKIWFWGGLFTLGIAVSVSGFVLDFPNFEQTRAQMQLAWTVHAIGALLFMLAAVGHIYMGTVGVEGAYGAMRTGYVDETWAREHHEWWYDDLTSGKLAAQRNAGPRAPDTERTQPA